jgi:hypothetical protein
MDERLELAGGLFRKPWSVSIDMVAKITWATADSLPPPQDVLWRPSPDQDRLLIRDGDTFRAVAGLMEQLDSDQIVIDVDGEQRKLARSRVAALVFASPDQPASQEPGPSQPGTSQRGPSQRGTASSRRELWLADGSRWHVESVTFDERGWRAIGTGAPANPLGANGGGPASAPAASVELPPEAVVELRVHSPRLRWLSELSPSDVSQRTWVAWPLPWGRDRAVTGGSLRIAGQRFERGVATQAGTRLVYALPDDAAWFVATIGLDDAARHRGDCDIAVYADAVKPLAATVREPLVRWRIQGGQPPRQLLVPVAGHKRLALVVEPGAGLDVGDHVDWGDARLILAKTTP